MTKDIFKWGKQNAALTVIATVLLQFIVLITASEALVHWIPGWWYLEYSRYDVVRFIPGGMSTKDGAYVTDEMINYCVGERSSLDDVTATIGGESRPFFSSREKLHLKDCRRLIRAALILRNLAVAGLILCCAVIAINRRRAARHSQDAYRSMVIARMDRSCAGRYLKTVAIVMAVMLLLVAICAIDFNSAFTAFHKIFFDNDYWILYPSSDYLVILMREEIFRDTAAVICAVWFVATGIPALISRKLLRSSAQYTT